MYFYHGSRIKFYLTERYTSIFKNLRIQGPADSRIIIVTFKIFGSEKWELFFEDTHDDLKVTPESESPRFHPYDAAAIRTDEILRSLTVTDIPLFLSKTDVKATFANLGTIAKFTIRTLHNSKISES